MISRGRRAARAAAKIRAGNRALGDGDLAAALQAYNAALDEDPENPYAWNNKGIVLETLGRGLEAVKCHNRAIAARPNYVEAHVNHMSRDEGAQKALTAALRLSPNHELAWLNRGILYARRGRMPEALECFEKSLAADPSYASAIMNKGSALAALGRADEAVDCYNAVLQKRPDFADAWFHKGRILLDGHRAKAAILCFEKALELSPNLAAGRQLLAAAQAQIGRAA
jgi:tetratricopeptide (TPR) repeat protein